MLQTPKSLTATIHVRFNYQDLDKDPVTEGETEMLARVLDQAGEMEPEMQEILIKFAGYLNQQKAQG
ncbi:hypothetical protein ES703_108947 [subsurface metagenome]